MHEFSRAELDQTPILSTELAPSDVLFASLCVSASASICAICARICWRPLCLCSASASVSICAICARICWRPLCLCLCLCQSAPSVPNLLAASVLCVCVRVNLRHLCQICWRPLRLCLRPCQSAPSVPKSAGGLCVCVCVCVNLRHLCQNLLAASVLCVCVCVNLRHLCQNLLAASASVFCVNLRHLCPNLLAASAHPCLCVCVWARRGAFGPARCVGGPRGWCWAAGRAAVRPHAPTTLAPTQYQARSTLSLIGGDFVLCYTDVLILMKTTLKQVLGRRHSTLAIGCTGGLCPGASRCATPAPGRSRRT